MPEKRFFESVLMLRGIAALLVVFSHDFGWYSNLPLLSFLSGVTDDLGQIGVTIFFVISGFVLPYSLTNTYSMANFPSFMLKRLTRIEPVFLTSVLCAAIILYVKTRIAPNAIPFELNIYQLLAHFLYLIPFTHYSWLNEVYWTLAIEFQFYILIGLSFPLLRKLGAKGTLYALSFILLFSLLSIFREETRIGLFRMAPLFSIGIAVFYLKRLEYRKNAPILLMVIAGLGIYYASYNGIINAICGVATAYLIVFWNPQKYKLRFFGTISYSLYVIHYPLVTLINQTAKHFLGDSEQPIVYLVPVANLILVTFIAYLLYTLVEKPSLDLSKRIKYKVQNEDQRLNSFQNVKA